MSEQPAITTARPRRRSSGEVHRLILAAARQLLDERGPSVTVAEIAERAGVTRMALFRHFGDKASLIVEAQRESAHAPAEPAGDVRDTLRRAARELFAQHGYANTSTRRVAEHAGVPEVVVFRTFGTKAALFQESVFEPFGEFISRFAAQWSANAEPHSPEAISHEYFDGLYRLVRENIATVLALVTARTHDQYGVVDVDEQHAALGEVIRGLEQLCGAEAAAFGYDELNVAFATRISIGMVIASALFKEWLFDDAVPATDEQIVDELTKMLVHGLAQRSTASDPASDLAAAHRRIARLEADVARLTRDG